MRLRLRSLIMATTALGLAAAPQVKAQTLEELKAQLQTMQHRIDQLESQQRRTSGQVARQARRAPGPRGTETGDALRAAEDARESAAQARQAAQDAQQRAQQEAEKIKQDAVSETLAQFNPPPGKPGGLTFRIPRVDTTVRLYGFVKVNANADLTAQDQSDALTAQAVQLSNSAGRRQGGATSIAARRSRVGLETWTPINDTVGEFHTQFEMDFAGGSLTANTPATNNSYIPRLRLAYADFGFAKGGWGNFLFGQQASTFNDQVLLPIQWMSDWDFAGISNVRQAQFRYTYGFANGLSASAAVESPYSDVTTVAGGTFPDATSPPVGWQLVPDFAGRLMWRDPKIGLLALRGVVRPQVNLNNNGATALPQRFNRGTTGYGVGLTGVLNLIGGKLVLMASGNIGTGLGRYLTNTSNGFGAVSNFGLPGVTADDASINPVSVYGGMVGAQYFFTPTLRTNMSLGGARILLPSYTSGFCTGATTTACSTLNSGLWAAAINLVWSPFNAVDLGIEYQHLERSLQAPFISGGLVSRGGMENRIELTTIGRF